VTAVKVPPAGSASTRARGLPSGQSIAKPAAVVVTPQERTEPMATTGIAGP
jgi:hypothetical protein